MTLLDRTAPERFLERPVPVLATERLVLRAPRLEDAKAIATLVNDRRIAENTARIPHPYALADAHAFLTHANASDRETVFLITLRADEPGSGRVSSARSTSARSRASSPRDASSDALCARTLEEVPRRPLASLASAAHGSVLGCCGIEQRDGPEIGYWLGVPFWGQGYATEAARALVDHAFGDLGCDTLQAGARVSNPASRRVLEKCGFQWTGVGLYRIRALASSAPCDRFRLDRGLWAIAREDGRKRP
jgi:RimJ/RimL family protein N-acetyltransferase